LLSCRIPVQESALGPSCCRLSSAHRAGTARSRRYPSDTTDAQWAVIDPLLPDPAWLAGKGGRPEAHCRRQIVDAIFYLVDNGIKWRALPADLPPWSTVYKFFAAWEADGVTGLLVDMLRERVRLAEGRAATPTAAIIDSQTVKAAENVWRSSRGYDAGKKINGRKRHIAVDTLGLLICVLVTAASIQDRDGARPLLQRLVNAAHRVRHVWADGGYAGKLLDWARDTLHINVQIVKRSDDTTGSLSCPDVGSWNAASPGSPDTAAAPETTKPYPPTTKPWSAGP
jgi:transposase